MVRPVAQLFPVRAVCFQCRDGPGHERHTHFQREKTEGVQGPWVLASAPRGGGCTGCKGLRTSSVLRPLESRVLGATPWCSLQNTPHLLRQGQAENFPNLKSPGSFLLTSSFSLSRTLFTISSKEKPGCQAALSALLKNLRRPRVHPCSFVQGTQLSQGSCCCRRGQLCLGFLYLTATPPRVPALGALMTPPRLEGLSLCLSRIT